ncbi:MAG: hypothetical protein JST51_19845 [Armatimonadetes bacterium]|nr:hypothetical protein [Armatimonadota bacterium]
MSIVQIIALLLSPVPLPPTSEAASIANKLEAAHNKMTTAAVFVSDGLSAAIPSKLYMSPSYCVLAMPNQQIVELHTTEVKFFDQLFNQVASMKPQKPLKIPESSSSVAIVQREPLAWLVDSVQRNQFFTEVKRDPRWSVGAGKLVLNDAKKKIHSEVVFDSKYHVTQIKMSLNNKTLTDWRYRYVAGNEIPGIPKTAREVKGLSPRPAIPAKTQAPAVETAQKLWRSVSRLENRTVIQANNDGTYELTFHPGEIRETGPEGSWTLRGTTLDIKPNKGKSLTLKGESGKFLEGLRSAGITASPFAWYILNRKLPYLDVFDGCQTLELEGTGSFEGKTMSILSVKRPGSRVRLYVDPTTGDLDMVSSDAVDAKTGEVISSSRMKITYR